MSWRERSLLVGVFNHMKEAEDALDELRVAGFPDDQLGLVTRTSDSLDASAGLPSGTTGAAAGAILGGTMGTLWGLGIVAGLLPGIGPAVAGESLAAILSSAAAGSAVAGVAGYLIGLGIPEEEARQYERKLQAGRVLVTVHTLDRYDEAAAILQRRGAYTDPRLATPY